VEGMTDEMGLIDVVIETALQTAELLWQMTQPKLCHDTVP